MYYAPKNNAANITWVLNPSGSSSVSCPYFLINQFLKRGNSLSSMPAVYHLLNTVKHHKIQSSAITDTPNLEKAVGIGTKYCCASYQNCTFDAKHWWYTSARNIFLREKYINAFKRVYIYIYIYMCVCVCVCVHVCVFINAILKAF